MAIKFFTNALKGNPSDSIAINSVNVMTIFEGINTDHDTNEVQTITNIYGTTSQTWSVEEDMATVVSRLNERD
jgi:hypothetical protein